MSIKQLEDLEMKIKLWEISGSKVCENDPDYSYAVWAKNFLVEHGSNIAMLVRQEIERNLTKGE